MLQNRQKALGYVLIDEGAELNVDPGEPGGASKYGVSVLALSEARAAKGIHTTTVDDVAALTPETASEFYAWRYCGPTMFDDLPNGVDYRLLDISINLGPTGGVWALELVLGVWPPTGKMSKALVMRAALLRPEVLIAALGAYWVGQKRASASWPQHGHGWINRYSRAQQRAIEMAGSV